RDEAKQRPLPTKVGGNPENIPSNEEMVTQILPVKFISAEQLIKNLEMLLPTSSTLTANAGANALIITEVVEHLFQGHAAEVEPHAFLGIAVHAFDRLLHDDGRSGGHWRARFIRLGRRGCRGRDWTGWSRRRRGRGRGSLGERRAD
ncbi:MAG: hypothetical protein EBY09_09575, partial [Verrucomicrobia bacterium]|nr:hypothetical protein [Verrucomicrobiota bacterium]